MLRFPHLILAICFAITPLAAVYAQTAGVSFPAWIDEGDCGAKPKFDATLNGKPAPVISQLGPGSDQMILVVTDFTGDLSLVEAAKQALTQDIPKLDSNIWVGLMRDQDGLHVLADPNADRKPLLQAISDLASTGKPGLFESVTPALTLADSILRKSPIRVAVLYITDSNIYNYREDYTNPVINASDPHDLSRVFPDALIQDKIARLAEDVSALEAPLFVVHINYRSDTLNLSYQNGLISLTEDMGGMGQICRSVGEVPDAIAAAFNRITHEWRLNLEIPPKFHGNAQIRLTVPCGGADARISWRARLRPKEG